MWNWIYRIPFSKAFQEKSYIESSQYIALFVQNLKLQIPGHAAYTWGSTQAAIAHLAAVSKHNHFRFGEPLSMKFKESRFSGYLRSGYWLPVRVKKLFKTDIERLNWFLYMYLIKCHFTVYYSIGSNNFRTFFNLFRINFTLPGVFFFIN